MIDRLRILLGSVLLGLFVFGTSAPVVAQISPGPLSDVHAHLEGIRHCRDCHGKGGQKGLDAHCLECHTALAFNLESSRGLHASEGREDCAACHPEHAGRNFDLIDWGNGGREAFDHARTGWELAGAHAKVECAQCHRSEFRVPAIELRRPKESDDDTYLGLTPSCAGCHADPHERRLGRDCQTCHSPQLWNDVASFDHGRTAFALRGKHTALKCAACHENGKFGRTETANARLHLRPIAFDECSACHKDPHAGRFGAACSRCHNTDDFERVPKNRFDHDRTNYPLRGEHTRVSCDRCHEPAQGGFGPKPQHSTCNACHDDAHAKTATLASQPVDCAVCHDVGGFAPSTFDVDRHAQTSFALEGRHANVPCAKCHEKSQDAAKVARFGRAGIQLHPDSQACTDCHEAAHGDQFSNRDHRGACEVCHDTQGWRPSTFTVARHDDVFPLKGAHAAAHCASCHAPDRPGLGPLPVSPDPGPARWSFRLAERKCIDCHIDLHDGRYEPNGVAAALGPCSACHDTRRFSPSLVDIDMHDRFGFSLEGSHRATPCVFCHAELDGRSRLAEGTHALARDPQPDDLVLWKVPSSCADCHKTGESE